MDTLNINSSDLIDKHFVEWFPEEIAFISNLNSINTLLVQLFNNNKCFIYKIDSFIEKLYIQKEVSNYYFHIKNIFTFIFFYFLKKKDITGRVRNAHLICKL